MSLLGPDGKPTAHDGPTGRYIKIIEHVMKGRPVWGVEFEGSFELLEMFQILSDVIRGIAQRERSLVAENRAMQEVKQKMASISTQEKA